MVSIRNLRPLFAAALIPALCLCSRPAHATTDAARADSRYFSATSSAGTSGPRDFYAHRWRTWLQYHRAIEKVPSLQRQLLQLPEDPYEGRKGARSLMHAKLSTKVVRAQPTHVYVLQLRAYRNSRGIAAFMKRQWPRVADKSIYDETPKDFRVGFNSEALTKSEPVYLLSDKLNNRRMRRLCYGLYASQTDAKRDAAQFKRHLGYQPVVLRRPLTTQLAHSVIFEPILGKQP